MIYICIPTHNEQQTVGVVLWKLRQVLTEFHRDYQLLVADDASTDRTPEVLEPYTRVLPLTVIRSDTRLGHAACLEMLLREAVRRSEYPKRDAIVTIQADFSDEPDDIVPLIKRIEAGADVAVGNKVSSTRDLRSRRAARWLAGFFARRQKWPEGVTSPFDGYRAFRLYAVRRAIEDREGRRLIRFDGWAGHAELLRAVLPHARRVDVVNVDDRRDRLQRGSRERAFAAALQVRALAGGTEPAGLAPVEELDRVAATASRSRERTAAAARPAVSRQNGGRTRDGRDRGAARSRTNGAAGRGRERGTGRGRTQDEARTGSPRAKSGGRTAGASSEGRRRKPRQAPPEAAAAEDVVPQNAAGGDQEAPAERPKRKRRRRRKSGTAGSAPEQAGGAEGPAGTEAAAADAPAADGESAGQADAPKKRRRRGGRRGGRGRKRPQSDAGAEPAGGTADAGSGVESAAEAPARAEHD